MSEAAAEPQYRKRIGYQAMLLGGFTALACVLLVSGNLATRDAIAERVREDLLASLNQVIPTSHYENNLLDDILEIKRDDMPPVTVYRGIQEGEVSALAYVVMEPGYSGEIRILMGIDSSGTILGARVLSHTETPGLGDKIEVQKDDWIKGFNGLNLRKPAPDRWKVKNDGGEFDAFSGATITPRAVVKAIREGLEFFSDNRYRLLKLEPREMPHE